MIKESYAEKIRAYEEKHKKRWSDWHTPKGRTIVDDLLTQLGDTKEEKK